MAGRKRKYGIDFSGWDVDVFDDPKIEQLIDRMGLDGFVVFFCVCQRIYAGDGYYMPWSQEMAPGIKKALGGCVDSRFVMDVVDMCLDLGLFLSDTFAQYGVLTSRAIQRNYAAVLARRRCKNVAAEYWVLPKNESNGAEPVPLALLG